MQSVSKPMLQAIVVIIAIYQPPTQWFLKEVWWRLATMLIKLHVCFSVKVMFDCTSICEVSCLWNQFYKQEVCGPTLWIRQASWAHNTVIKIS